MRSIVAEFECADGRGVDPACQWCAGTGYVCVVHPWLPWGPSIDDETPCQCDGDGGMPCKAGAQAREAHAAELAGRPVVDVVWVSRHSGRLDPFPVASRGYWDQGILEALFAGDLWRTGITFRHRYGFEELADGAVVVVPARHHASAADVAWLNERLAPLPWVLLVLTGDEEGVFPREAVRHPNLRVWVQTPKLGTLRPDERPMGDGWPPQCPRDLASQPIEKPEAWFFAGQITHEERRSCRDALAQRLATHGDGAALFTEGFTRGLPAGDYYRGLARAKVAPCPGGPETPDTFRLFEALEAGCIPVVLRHPYWGQLFGEVPFPQLAHWSQFGALVDNLISRWPANANVLGAWWLSRKRQMALDLVADLASLGAPAPAVSRPGDRVTVLIPTSLVPAHPSTAGIEQTVASVLEQFPGAEILLLVDGLTPEQEDRRADYDEYTRRLLHLCRRWPDTMPVLFVEHAHQSGMLHRALPMVTTPLVAFVEHDTPLVGPIDWEGISEAILSGEASVVRFHHEAAVLPEHAHLMLDSERRPVGPLRVPMLRTAQWSSRPHLASTAFYRELVARFFAPEARTFTEDVLNAVLESAWFDFGAPAWYGWRLWLYAPDEPGPMGGIKRSTHTDGRAGAPKAECVIAYPGETPPGAPRPSRERVSA